MCGKKKKKKKKKKKYVFHQNANMAAAIGEPSKHEPTIEPNEV
jgi:hypothetical protein